MNKLSLAELIEEAEKEEEQGIRWKHRTLKRRLLNFRKYLMDNYYYNTVSNTFTPVLVVYKYFEIEIHDLPRIDKKVIIIPNLSVLKIYLIKKLFVKQLIYVLLP